MQNREIQLFAAVSGKYQTSYDLDELSTALDDIESNGYQVISVSFAPDGNLVLIVANILDLSNEV